MWVGCNKCRVFLHHEASMFLFCAVEVHSSPWDTLSPTVRVSHWGEMVKYDLVTRFFPPISPFRICTIHPRPLVTISTI